MPEVTYATPPCFQAHEVLLAGRKLTAVEALNCGFVTEVIPQAEFEKEVDKKMKHLVSLPPNVSVVMYSYTRCIKLCFVAFTKHICAPFPVA